MSTTESDKQRVIKFRVWDKASKQMSDPFTLFGEFTLIGGVHDWQSEFGIEGDSLVRLSDLVEMQFIGLSDKNGKEIYDGDIVQFQQYNKTKGLTGEVYWDHSGSRWKWGSFNITKNEAKKLAVIGHIYSLPSVTTKEDKEVRAKRNG